MPRKSTYPPLKVYLNNGLVGTLRRKPDGAVSFVYAPEWLSREEPRQISRSLPLRPEPHSGEAVMAVFDNLLPDDRSIRERVAERVGAAGSETYSLLAAIGHDCTGALQFLPEGVEPEPLEGIQSEPLKNSDIARLLTELSGNPLGLHRDEEFRISLAGVQEKTALLRYKDTWHRPIHTTPTSHILKPPIGKLANGVDMSDSVENEFLCMQFLHAAGLPVAEVAMSTFTGIQALVITRFDRRWLGPDKLVRVPQEDMCQALGVPSSLKYDAHGGPGIADILEILQECDNPLEDQKTFLKAQIVFWLMGATDGHAKNFSVFMTPGGGMQLTPIYDVLSVYPLLARKQLKQKQAKLAMAVGNNRHYRLSDIRPKHFYQSAKQAGVGKTVVDRAFQDLAEAVPKALEQTQRSLARGFPVAVSEPVLSGIQKALRSL